MRLTEIGKDLLVITDADLNSLPVLEQKVHLIKFDFEEPTKEKILRVMDHFNGTNRFIISNNIRFYNGILKTTSKKYYIQNRVGQTGIVSFFRKNNKVLLSLPSLDADERQFVLRSAFEDVLKNLEVIMMERRDYEDCVDKFRYWKGNVILFDPSLHGFVL